MRRGGRREKRGGEILSVLIPLLIAPIFSAIVVVFKHPDADHDRAEWSFGAIRRDAGGKAAKE